MTKWNKRDDETTPHTNIVAQLRRWDEWSFRLLFSEMKNSFLRATNARKRCVRRVDDDQHVHWLCPNGRIDWKISS